MRSAGYKRGKDRFGMLFALALVASLGLELPTAEARPATVDTPARSNTQSNARPFWEDSQIVLAKRGRKRKKKRRRKRPSAKKPAQAAPEAVEESAPETLESEDVTETAVRGEAEKVAVPAPTAKTASAPEPDPAGGSLRRSSEMEFDARLVRGETAGTGAVILFNRGQRPLAPLVKQRARFLDASLMQVYGPDYRRPEENAKP